MSDKYHSESRGELSDEQKAELRKKAIKEVSASYKFTEADKRANAEARAPAVVYDDDAEQEDLYASRFPNPREEQRK